MTGFSTMSMTSSDGWDRGCGSDTYTMLSPDISVYPYIYNIEWGGEENKTVKEDMGVCCITMTQKYTIHCA